jgi:hypothetical protein
MLAWLPELLIVLSLGIAASLYLWLVRRRKDEVTAGMLTLAGLPWREFSGLVLVAMKRRGYRQISADSANMRIQRSDFLLEKDGRRVLLACKHSSAYRIDSAMLDELVSNIRLHDAHAGILVTEGLVDQNSRSKAAKAGIEPLRGKQLWLELKPLLGDTLRHQVVHNVDARARRHIGIAWLGAIAVGAIAGVLLPNAGSDASGSGSRPAPTAQHAPPPAQANGIAAQPVPATVQAPPSEVELEMERADFARSISTIGGLVRGAWISRSTLAVDRTAGEEQAWSLICAELSQHPNLALTRVQMNPPPGSDEQVRWRQCEMLQR